MQLRTGRSRCRRDKSSRILVSSSSDSSPAKDESELFPFGSIGTEESDRASIVLASPFGQGGEYGTSSDASVKESEDVDGDSNRKRLVSHKSRKKSKRRHIAISSDSGVSSSRTLSQRSWRTLKRISSPSELVCSEATLDNTPHQYPERSTEIASELYPSILPSTSFPNFSFSPSRAVSPTFRRTRHRTQESPQSIRRRWLKTADVLKKSGLLDVTIKTAELMRQNQKLQKDIENLQKETNKFVASVLSNPENRQILENIQSQAQLYEVVVPGSQRLMMKTIEQNLPSPFTFQLVKSPEERSVSVKSPEEKPASVELISNPESQELGCS